MTTSESPAVDYVNHLEALVADQTRTLGRDHPDTLSTRLVLARERKKTGDIIDAFDEMNQLHLTCMLALGGDHPTYLAVDRELRQLRSEAGAEAYAEVQRREQARAAALVVAGPDDARRAAWSSRAAQAHERGRTGDSAGAVFELEQLVGELEGQLPYHDPDLLAVRTSLACWRWGGRRPGRVHRRARKRDQRRGEQRLSPGPPGRAQRALLPGSSTASTALPT